MNKSVPLVATGISAVVAAASLAATTSASADDGGKGTTTRPPVLRAQVSSCTGGAAIGMRSSAMDFQTIAAGATADVEGSLWNVKGPKKGTDTVLVTLSALALNGASQLGYATLYRDGVATNEGQKYFGYGSTPATVQFCTKISKGQHQLVLRMQDDGGSSLTLYNPTITYQRFN